MKKKSISVAMCTFNGGRYLYQQLKSIENQTYPVSDVVIRDDGSTDSTLDIINEFQRRGTLNITVIQNSKNLGVIKNFELTIGMCTGEFVALADQDDVWLPQKLEIILGYFETNPDCGYVFSNAELVDSEGLILVGTLFDKIGFDSTRQSEFNGLYQLETMLNRGSVVYGTTLVYRNCFKSEILPIDSESLACTHDTWISLYLTAIGMRGIALPLPLVQYRQHSGQMFGAVLKKGKYIVMRSFQTKRPDLDESYSKALAALSNRVLLSKRCLTITQISHLKLREKSDHISARCKILAAKWAVRWVMVYDELKTNRYQKYSSSFLSAIKDCVFMSH